MFSVCLYSQLPGHDHRSGVDCTRSLVASSTAGNGGSKSSKMQTHPHMVIEVPEVTRHEPSLRTGYEAPFV